MKISCNCFVCGKTFEREPFKIKRAVHPVCSRECANELKRRDIVETQCCICGKPLIRRASRLKIRPNPVCSKSCHQVLRHRIKFDPTISEAIRQTDRNYDPRNRQFVQKVMERDDYTCQICGQRGGDLAVHHLNGYHWDIEHRFDTENGITLCEKHHKDFHKQYGQNNNTKEQFDEYANQNRRLH